MKTNYPQPAEQPKIPFWRRRWFWGIPILITILFIIKFPLILHCPLYTFWNKLIIHFSNLALGFLLCVLIIPYLFFADKTKSILYFLNIISMKIHNIFGSERAVFVIYIIFIALYYFLLLFLIYKIFKNKKVKIKYPILFIIILLLSFVMGATALIFTQC